jgi:hypothetical protein
MHSEGFAVNQIHVMEPWPDEPSEEAGLAWARSGLESACGINRLRKLPPSPFRSVGGYLDYAEWPDCQRFMELDRLIQVYALESQNPPKGADSDDSQVCPLERQSPAPLLHRASANGNTSLAGTVPRHAGTAG